MNRKLTLLTVAAVLIAASIMTAGGAAASMAITCDSVIGCTGTGTDRVSYTGSWSSGLGATWWDPFDNSTSDGDKYGFVSKNFTVSEYGSVTIKVSSFTAAGGTYTPSDTTIYLYEQGFDKSDPNTNKKGSWDGATGILWAVETGKTYTLVVTSDNNNIPSGAGLGTVTAEITATAVPVPAAVWLLGSGLFGLAGLRRTFLKA
jgi:hypothetical protein